MTPGEQIRLMKAADALISALMQDGYSALEGLAIFEIAQGFVTAAGAQPEKVELAHKMAREILDETDRIVDEMKRS